MSRKTEIIRLSKSGMYAKQISATLGVSIAYVYKIARKNAIVICAPPQWNKGKVAITDPSVLKYTLATRDRMRSVFERRRRTQQNKQMWLLGRFTPSSYEQLAKARGVWVAKVKAMAEEDRRKTLANFTAAGNKAQSELRSQHMLDIDWYKNKYPWAENAHVTNCAKCGVRFISSGVHQYTCGLEFCSARCFLDYRSTLDNPNYVFSPTLAARVKEVKCRKCDRPFLSVCSKWSRKFCSKACWIGWLVDHPNFTVKRQYFSQYFSQSYVYDSSYELDFILWCERFGPLSLLRNRPIIPYGGRRYFCDFLIDDVVMVEIKASNPVIYDVQRECTKIRAAIEFGAANNMPYKLVTEKQLYFNKSINDALLVEIIDNDANYIGAPWNTMI